MSAEYALFKNPNPNKDDEKTTLHARIVGGTVVNTEHIIEELKRGFVFFAGRHQRAVAVASRLSGASSETRR